jgi:hypothetical protein
MATRKPRRKSKPAPVEYYFDYLEYSHFTFLGKNDIDSLSIRIGSTSADPEIYEIAELDLENRPIGPRKLPNKVVAHLDALMRELRFPLRPTTKYKDGNNFSAIEIYSCPTLTRLQWFELDESWAGLQTLVDAILHAARRAGITMPNPCE